MGNQGGRKRTTAHFLPSKANLDGFFPASAVGLLGLVGFFADGEGEGEGLLAGTGPEARRDGFL